MVYAQLLKDIVEIGTTTLVFAETFQYTAKGIMYPRLKSDLEKLVESGEMNREEANYRLRIYKTYILLPWPIGEFYVTRKLMRHDRKQQKSDQIKE